MQVFHDGGTENDEDPHPEGPALEGDGLVNHFFAFFICLFASWFVLEKDCVEIHGQNAQHEG